MDKIIVSIKTDIGFSRFLNGSHTEKIHSKIFDSTLRNKGGGNTFTSSLMEAKEKNRF